MSQGLTAPTLISNLTQQWWIEYLVISSTIAMPAAGYAYTKLFGLLKVHHECLLIVPERSLHR